MGAIQDILANLDVNQIAAALGQNPSDVESAATTAVGSLLTGLEGNLEDPQGAISLANALGNHIDDNNAAPQTGAIDLGQIDFADGAKIVNHILPASQQQQLFGGLQGALIQKLMPLLAPIVMAYFAKKLSASGGLGSVLGQVLGGGAPQQQQSGGGLGDILGQILGGGAPAQQAQQSNGGLGDILGQILGGAQAAPQAQPQAHTQEPTWNQPNTGGLTMDDPGADAAAASAPSVPSVGGLLKSILFG